jgi:NAD(P)-dependent dehydrogenase (short-subunit alcohol dehydrogenase family)
MTDQHNQQTGRLLITGATGGMGRACAQLAAADGYQLILADLSSTKLDELASECGQQGAATECHTLDVTQSDSIGELVAALQARGGVDAIIHTVGVSPQMAVWEQIIEIDLVGTLELLELARPSLKPGGCALAIASMSAYMCPPDEDIEQAMSDPLAPGFIDRLKALSNSSLENPGLAYAYAKKALKHYVENRASAWGKEGKRFVSLSPGLIDTEMGRLENDAMENFEAMRSLVALDRLGDPEDIANTCLFLVSDRAAYISGCDILVDGGFVAAMNEQQRRAPSS